MYNSLSCVVGKKVDQDSYSDLFGYICGLKNGQYCNGITANATTGSYGAYGMCDAEEQLSYVMNAYAKAQSDVSSGCAFSGSASIKSATSASGACSSLVAQAGTAGTGIITSSPTATGAGAAGSSGSSSSSSGAATPLNMQHVQIGMVSLGFYVLVAVTSGAAMIVL